jgi:hypothetical protein
MKVEPKNGWILVELLDEAQEQDSVVLLPEDYKKVERPYKIVRVVNDPEFKYEGNVVVPIHVIREIDLSGGKFYLIERNHIMAGVGQ